MRTAKKLVIVGGGIAGCYAAYLASQKNIPTVVFEKARKNQWFQSPLVTRRCAEGIWQKKLQQAGIRISLKSLPSYVESSTTSLLLGRLQEKKIDFVKLKIKPYLFLNRQRFLRDFQQKSQKPSIRWNFNSEIEDLRHLNNDSTFVLGAWGTSPFLLNKILKPSYVQEYVLACQQTFLDVSSKTIEDSKIVVLVDDPEIRYFYLFPKGQSGEVNVGVGFNNIKVKNPFERLNSLIKLFPDKSLNKAKIDSKRSFIKILCAGSPIEKDYLLGKNFALIGDAGFTTDAVSGGGIGYGLYAAKQAIMAFSTFNPQRKFYNLMEGLFVKLKRSYKLSHALYSKDLKERKRANECLFSTAKELLHDKELFSLSKITKIALGVS